MPEDCFTRNLILSWEKTLWPISSTGEPWSCVFFLDDIKNVDVSLDDIRRLAGYNERFIVQGFQPLNEPAVNRIYSEYGSIENFLNGNETVQSVDLAEVCNAFSSALLNSGVSFGSAHRDFVRTFVTSLATKRLVILTGLSGSGKTQIGLQFGDWLGDGRSLVVPVRPDWTGTESLFGYEDALMPSKESQRAWQVPEVLDFMLKAAADRTNPYLLVLDEMNLAHVERYFADVLSGMESDRECLPNLKKDQDAYWRCDPSRPKLVFPRNLFIVGTVNVDETTYMFSPKVLDRANTIEFRISTPDLNLDIKRPSRCAAGNSDLVRSFLAIAQDDNWHLQHPMKEVETFFNHFKDLHALLSEAGLEFGHRVLFEALRFGSVLNAAGEENWQVALDLQVMQKVLPRLHGSRRRLESTMCALAKFCFDLRYEPLSRPEEYISRFDPIVPPQGNPVLVRSFGKVQRMTRSLRANQFTSFTE